MEQDNVTSINQSPPVNDASEYIAFQQRLINDLQQQVLDNEKPVPEPKSLKKVLANIKPDETYKPVYKIRRMTHKDTMKVIRMVNQVWYKEEIQDAVKTGNQSVMLNEVFQVLLTELEETLIPWFADLAQIENIEEEPASVVFDIYNDLKATSDFLSLVRSAVYAGMTSKNLFGR